MTLGAPFAFELQNISKFYQRDGKRFCAVDGVSLRVRQGESLALVGESGAGKSTLAKLLIKQTNPSGGRLLYRGKDITHLSIRDQKSYWKDVQMITQDPSVAFNPKKRVRQILTEPLENFRICDKAEYRRRMIELLESVGLDRSFLDRFPSQMSGGEQQRISLARALAVDPSCLILDEATSALDMTLQEQLIELLIALRKEKGLTYLFIHHDLGVAQKLAGRIVVMKAAKIVEVIDSAKLAQSSDEYVGTLVDAVFGLNEPRGSMFDSHIDPR